MPDISERSFEEAIECGLLRNGPDACAGDATAVRELPATYGEGPPGGYRRRAPEEYDRTLCLIPRDVVDFVLATQPKEWKKLEQHHGAAAKERFLTRLAKEIARRGALDVLRNGCCGKAGAPPRTYSPRVACASPRSSRRPVGSTRAGTCSRSP